MVGDRKNKNKKKSVELEATLALTKVDQQQHPKSITNPAKESGEPARQATDSPDNMLAKTEAPTA